MPTLKSRRSGVDLRTVVGPLDRPSSTDVGTVKMRMPDGKRSAITVAHAPTGAIDIHFSRTSEGEALMRLPVYAAKELGDLLLKAAANPT